MNIFNKKLINLNKIIIMLLFKIYKQVEKKFFNLYLYIYIYIYIYILDIIIYFN